MLEFGAKTAELLDTVYVGADVTRRRQTSFDALRPGPGESIVDIGCGNGLLTAELARAVGPDGRIIGVDPSPDMRASALDRCKGFDWVEIVEGFCTPLPVDTGAVDKAVSVQVFEYLDDIPAAVREAHRVLRPGGRLVVGDIHLDSLVWFSAHPDRMARMIAAWDRHFVERGVPAILPPILTEHGFEVKSITPNTICDHQLKPDGLANMMLILMERYAVSNGHLSVEDAREWSKEQRDLATAGRFFYSISHFVVSARKLRASP